MLEQHAKEAIAKAEAREQAAVQRVKTEEQAAAAVASKVVFAPWNADSVGVFNADTSTLTLVDTLAQ